MKETNIEIKKQYHQLNIDFNTVAEIISSDSYESILSSYWLHSHILNSIFQIKNVEKNNLFKDIFMKLNSDFNPKKLNSDLSLFLNFYPGASSHVHQDEYSVVVLGLYGKTFYKVNDKEVTLEKGDCLSIPKEATHQAISLSPRIIASFGVYDNTKEING
jgi:mannose-6-phosphate isomerase-like protein (cupin superfamily)